MEDDKKIMVMNPTVYDLFEGIHSLGSQGKVMPNLEDHPT